MYPAFRAASQKMRSGSEAGSLALRDAKVRGFESLRAIFLCPFRQRGFLRVYWCIENRSAFCYTCLKVGERRAKREKNDRSAAPGKAIAPPCAGQNKDHGYHDYLRVNELKFYDLHCHTSGISRCCRLNSEEILSKAKEVGYDGIVLTNHYTQGYLDGRDYSVFAEEYIAEYEKAKAQGEKIGVEVIFGVELTYEISPKIHILLYGATPDFIRQNREMYLLDSRALPWVIAGLMAFPPVYANVLAGIRGADRQLLEMARVFRVPPRRQLWGIWGPAVLPGFRAAVSVSTGLCWKAGAAAEVIGLCAGTIGEGLYTAKVYFQTAELFAWTAVIVALSALTEHLALWAVDALAGKAGIR